jgi:hypothetical protein
MTLRVEPLLFRLIVISRLKPIHDLPRFTADVVLRSIKHKPPHFFAKYVRHLYLRSAFDQIDVVLAACTGVSELFLGYGVSTDVRVLSSLRGMSGVRRLTLEIDPLFGGHPIDFNHPVLRNLTHLEILDSARDRNTSVWAGVTSIPNLTHLAFSDPEFCSIFGALLSTCARLQCVVFLCAEGDHIEAAQRLAGDSRFVVSGKVNLDVDWQHGAHEGDDYWARADALIASRQTACS